MFSLPSITSLALVLHAFASPIPEPRQVALKVLIGNDDGWAEANIRAMYDVAVAAGYNTLLSSPAENKSGSGSTSTTPAPRTSPCQYNSCPADSPATGHESNNDRIWYVNGYPVDGIKYALSKLVDTYLGGKPDLIITGPNVGANEGLAAFFSGTIGAATAGAAAGVPAIAFSGSSGNQKSFTERVAGDYSDLYAGASLKLAQALVAPSGPYLPAKTFLSVNYPEAGEGTRCQSVDDFKFVLAKTSFLDFSTTQLCGGSLPLDSDVTGNDEGCYASVSLLGTNKLDSSSGNQAIVAKRLASTLSCLP